MEIANPLIIDTTISSFSWHTDSLIRLFLFVGITDALIQLLLLFMAY